MDHVVEHVYTFDASIRGCGLAIHIVVDASARAVIEQIERLLGDTSVGGQVAHVDVQVRTCPVITRLDIVEDETQGVLQKELGSYRQRC